MREKDLLQRSEKMIRIEFQKLFGRFDYNVILNKDGLTILTGPNGYGKSTILKSIEAIGNEFNGLKFFFQLDFEKITVSFENNKKFIIKKDNGKLILDDVIIERNIVERYEEFKERMYRRNYFIKIEEDNLIDKKEQLNNGILLNDDYYIEYLYEKEINLKNKKDSKFEKILKKIKTLKQCVGKIYFIREQRLIKEKNKNRNRRGMFDEQEIINVIDELPNRLKELMISVQQDYSTVASKLDSTYPGRLFKIKDGITEDEYNQKIKEMSYKFELLNKYDLSTMQESVEVVFKNEHAKALKIYFEDFDVKYRVYEDFINKLDLYTDIINNRLSFKSIKISKELGISIVDEKNRVLELNQLSSGEKQEIVLFYDLIFETEKDVLLLIDEPEISLHITWQKKFMDDLLKIINYKKFNVIVATHSPQIINNHWDRQVDLGELYGMQLNKN